MSPRGAYQHRSRDPEDRFWEKVSIPPNVITDCWQWTAASHSTTKPYGKFVITGTVCNAHRVAWELINGPIPEGLCVLHRCDVPSCVNPAHLFLGTKMDNAIDMRAKGRGRWWGHGKKS